MVEKRIQEKMLPILMNYDNTCHRKKIFAGKLSEAGIVPAPQREQQCHLHLRMN